MRRFHCVLAGIAALAFTAGIATACDGEKTAQTASTDKACASSAVKTASLKSSSCAAKTASATASHCASKSAVKTASAAHCASVKSAGLTAASCASKAGKTCATTHVVYRVGETDTFDRDEAMAMADKNGASVQFVAAGAAYDDENVAKVAMTKAIYARLDEMLSVSTTVGGKAYACGVSATKTAKASGAPMHFVVAGREFEDKTAADAYLAEVKAAVEAIQLLDAEGQVVKNCAVSHCKTAGKTAGKTAFVLGDQQVTCPVTANYMAAQAKLAALASEGA